MRQHASSASRSRRRPRCNTRLHSRDRDAEHRCRFSLRRPLELCQSQRLAVGRGQHRNERGDVPRQLLLCRSRGFCVRRGHLDFGRGALAEGMAQRSPMVVRNRAPSDLVHPRAEPFIVAKAGGRPRCIRRKTFCMTSSTSADERTRRAMNGRNFASALPMPRARSRQSSRSSRRTTRRPQQAFGAPGRTAAMVADAM